MRLIFNIIVAFATALLPKICQAGYIKSFDIAQNFNNEGLATEFRLYFSLDSGLSGPNYVQLIWPWDLGYTTSWSDEAGSWGVVSDTFQDPADPWLIRFKQGPSAPGVYSYSVWFTDENRTDRHATLNNGWNYMIYIKAINPPTGTTGYYPPIQLSTISNSDDLSYIIYDSNPIFGYLYISPPPATAMTSTVVSNTDPEYRRIANPGYIATISITPTIAIMKRFRVVFTTTTEGFSFAVNTCKYKGTDFSPARLPSYFPGRFDFYFAGDLPAGTQQIFECKLSNPNFVTTGAIDIKTMSFDSNNVIEKNDNVGALETIAFNWGDAITPNKNLKVYFGWGSVNVAKASVDDYPRPFRYFKSFSAARTTYNTVKFGFKPQSATPLGVELVLSIKTMDTFEFKILKSTLVNSLPNAKDKLATCSFTNPATCGTPTGPCNLIVCRGVGPLDVKEEYFVSFKSYLVDGTSLTDVPADFGEIVGVDTNGESILEAQVGTLGDTTIKVNPDIFYNNIDNDGDGNYRANNLVHTVPNTGTPSDTLYGIKKDGTASSLWDLVFEHNIQRAMVTGGGLAGGDGLEIYTTPAIVASTVSSCAAAGNTFSGGSTCTIKTVGDPQTSPELWFTLLRLSPDNLNALFPGGMGKRTYRFTNIMITKSSSVMLADDGVFDFYVRGAPGVFSAPSIPNVTIVNSAADWLINSYVVQQGALDNIKVSMSSFWVTNSDGLTGERFPAFIRATGFFNPAERQQMKRLSIFFNNLEFFVEDDGTVPCSSPIGELNCTGRYGHDTENLNPFVMNRVDVDLSKLYYGTAYTNEFKIIIPVKTMPNKRDITFGMAVLVNYQFPFAVKDFFSSQYLRNFGVKSYAPAAGAGTSPDPIFKLDISGNELLIGHKASDQQQPTVFLVNEHTPTLLENSDTEIGAAMTYCAQWGWNQDDYFQINTITDGELAQCANVAYQATATIRVWCTYCPVEEDLNDAGAPQDIFNMTFPYVTGEHFLPAFQVWSQNTGELIYYGEEDPSDDPMAVRNSVDQVLFTTHPIELRAGYNNNRVSIEFLTKSGFPSNGKIAITTGDPAFGFTYNSAIATALFDGDSCTLSTFGTTSFECSLNAVRDYEGGMHNLTITGIDATIENNYIYDIHVRTDANEEIETNQGDFVYEVFGGDYELDIKDVKFTTSNQNAHAALSLKFKASKYTFANEEYVFDLGDFATTNIGAKLSCYVYEGEVISWMFKTCDISSLTSLVLVPHFEFWPNDAIDSGYLTLVITGGIVPAASAAEISGELRRRADGAFIQDKDPGVLLSTPAASSAVT